jgi:putative transposase
LDLPRSSFYYQPVAVSEEDLRLMRLLDEQYTATPFYGSRRMQVALQRAGHWVNRKHVQRLMRVMGLEAVGPKPRLSEPHPGHKVYPYLLRDVPITERPRRDDGWLPPARRHHEGLVGGHRYRCP